MVQILPEVPSFGAQFARNFGQGFGGGLERGLNIAQKLAGKREKKELARQKQAGRAYKDLESYYKSKFGYSDYLTPSEKSTFEKLYTDILLDDPDLPEQDARELAFQTFSKGGLSDTEPKGMESQGEESSYRPLRESTLENSKAVRELIREKPSALLTELPTALTKLLANRSGGVGSMGLMSSGRLRQLGFENPEGFETGKPKTLTEASEKYFRKNLPGKYHKGAELISDLQSGLLDAYLTGKAGNFISGKPPLVNPSEILGAAKSTRSAAQTAAQLQGNAFRELGLQVPEEAGSAIHPEILKRMQATKVAQKMAPAEVAATEYSPAKQILESRITQPPKTGTEMRIERAEPGSKLSPIKEIVETRQKQLKDYPKYSQEIIEDAAAREKRRANLIPKTERGKQNMATRIAVAHHQLPAIQSSYTKALARVRALENEMNKYSGGELERTKQLYEIAKQELSEAATDLENGIANSKYGTSKASVEESKVAARKKLEEISNAIEKGGDYKLSGHDYSPKMISEAKEISKRKALPNLRQDDFYNQIHERYLNPYRQRMGQLAEEIKSARAAGDWKAYDNLGKERNVIDKMIKSAEAEQTIHTHKLALRDIAETKKAHDRFSQLKPVHGESKAQQVAQEKMWRNQIKDARTTQERAKVIDSAIDEIAAKNPGQAKKILEEGERLKEEAEEFIRKIHEPKQPPKYSKASQKTKFGKRPEAPVPPGPPPLQLADARGIMKRLHDFLLKYPTLYLYGRDFLIGMVGGLVDELLGTYADDEDKLLGANTILSALGAHKIKTPEGAVQFGGKYAIRTAGAWLVRYVSKKIKVAKAQGQYHSPDLKERDKFRENPTWVQNRVRKREKKKAISR